MKIFRVLVLAVALIAGSGAAYLALNMLPDSATEMAVTPIVPMTDVLVAAADISPGASLNNGNIRWQPWPSDKLGKHAAHLEQGLSCRCARIDALLVQIKINTLGVNFT